MIRQITLASKEQAPHTIAGARFPSCSHQSLCSVNDGERRTGKTSTSTSSPSGRNTTANHPIFRQFPLYSALTFPKSYSLTNCSARALVCLTTSIPVFSEDIFIMTSLHSNKRIARCPVKKRLRPVDCRAKMRKKQG